MSSNVSSLSVMPGTKYFGPARVIEINEANGLVRVLLNHFESTDENCETWARLAIPLSQKLQWGDKILVAGETIDDFYIIGILHNRSLEHEKSKRLVSKSGAKVEVSGSPDEERLRVYSQHGRLVFEYDPETGKSRVDIPEGDLEISTRSGNIDFKSAKDIRFVSKQSIEMHCPKSIRMLTSDVKGNDLTAVNLESDKISLNSPEIGITSQKGDIRIDETEYTGKKVSGKIKNVKLIMERLESTANTVIEKVKNIYKTVEGLSQLKAGRMRTIVNASWQCKSKKAFLKAEEDFKIKGEKIHLG